MLALLGKVAFIAKSSSLQNLVFSEASREGFFVLILSSHDFFQFLSFQGAFIGSILKLFLSLPVHLANRKVSLATAFISGSSNSSHNL